MDDVRLRTGEAVRYASRSKQLGAAAIDAYVQESITALRREFAAAGDPFTQYHGCSKADEQIVEVCLPTNDGDNELPEQQLICTVVRGHECDYPEILAAYDALAAHAKEIGRELDGPPRETYLVDPGNRTAQMEVAFPLL
ncbi:MAG TPA: hypothetical protein VHQ89_09340 [Gaiellaceae bacterium]|nr:hypothetical protein [Gaiellaceae bacterium]